MSTTGKTHSLATEAEAAHILGLSAKTLRRWRWAGKGPHFVKVGGAVRYDPADLTSFIEASRRRSTSDHGNGADEKEAA
ncbi:MAG TPA: helix-turn-helix domain-containing protein [Afifellaceae bacterium]|nr:helix-turn-helix domain-containing protein [Afifellaceae bacterium]